MKIFINVFIFLLFCAITYSQNTVTGTFPGLANQQVNLIGFEGFDTYTIDSVKVNEKGVFYLSYSKRDYGMGYLVTENNKPFFLVLNGEIIKLYGDTFSFPETIEILKGTENKIFEKYASEHPRREQALNTWGYLEKIYDKDTLFTVQHDPKHAIANEKQRINTEDSLFLASLAPETYVSWYLPVRKLVSSVSTIAQYRTEEIPAAMASFRNMDYTDPRLHKSGLIRDLIESHFWLIENSGHSLDSVYIEMKISVDSMIENLLEEEQKLNKIAEYLFQLMEKHSLFEASEYLALKLLNEKSCIINNDFAAQLESYRAMKKGNIAPDIYFKKGFLAPGYELTKQPQKLSDLKSKYTVVVFGASWCPQCPNELSQIARLYEKWTKYSIEVVFVSLDEDEKIFNSFAGFFPFISICDFQKWESPVVKYYHVFSTPTIFLLDARREIQLRPNSVSQLDSWVDWYLVERNM